MGFHWVVGTGSRKFFGWIWLFVAFFYIKDIHNLREILRLLAPMENAGENSILIFFY